MSYYMVDADQRFCREGKCHDPVKPLPGIPQCVANPLDRERLTESNHQRRPTSRARDPAGHDPRRLDPAPGFPSAVAPRRWWAEPKPANVLVPLALFLLFSAHGVLDWTFYSSQGISATPALPAGNALGAAFFRAALFALAWHALRVKYPRYY